MEVKSEKLNETTEQQPLSDKKSEDHKKLIEYGINELVADRLDEIYKSGKLAHSDLDTRALDALKEFPVEAALGVLSQFLDSNLLHVSNKSAYLCGVMKTYRQKTRITPQEPFMQPLKGPELDKVKEILNRTNYKFDVTTGQRKYGPPPDWTEPKPAAGCEVFCGKLPNAVFEDELIPLFEKCGKIYDLRLMMDPLSGTNRGYAFVTYTSKEEAERATVDLDGYEIKPGKCIKVNISVPNLRLFIGNIPKSKGKEDIMDEFGKITSGLTEVIIYSSPDDRRKNRGFCFLEYESHKAASVAKRRLSAPNYKVWGCDIIVDWADPQEEPDDETMSKVKVLYVRNLTQEVTENRLKETFEAYGSIERVKKIKDYAFIHFNDRNCALKALEELNGKNLDGATLEVSLAKPPSDKKKKEEILRARERRMFSNMQGRAFGLMPQPISLMGGLPRPGYRAASNNIRMPGRGDFEWTSWGLNSWMWPSARWDAGPNTGHWGAAPASARPWHGATPNNRSWGGTGGGGRFGATGNSGGGVSGHGKFTR
ncbi:heterogeneous nuclear ribonucleoprotein R isoform X1 [Adelges cooleyi]|uniref:heterogeneous nuclear ribonucleoprotein R isoform X1 n=1 Tax=Adelges cooleyi TaxID=133065 RepID=UPI0021806AD0|nr:heterogeneous nuclear ribonucleoprotein R isoform X1 [Adelges cooleyi]